MIRIERPITFNMSTKAKQTRKRRTTKTRVEDMSSHQPPMADNKNEERDRIAAAEAMSALSSVILLSDSDKLIPANMAASVSESKYSKKKTPKGKTRAKRQGSSTNQNPVHKQLQMDPRAHVESVNNVNNTPGQHEVVVNISPKFPNSDIKLPQDVQQALLNKLRLSKEIKLAQERGAGISPSFVKQLSSPGSQGFTKTPDLNRLLGAIGHSSQADTVKMNTIHSTPVLRLPLASKKARRESCESSVVSRTENSEVNTPTSDHMTLQTMSNASVELTKSAIERLFQTSGLSRVSQTVSSAEEHGRVNSPLESSLPLKKRKLMSYVTEQDGISNSTPVSRTATPDEITAMDTTQTHDQGKQPSSVIVRKLPSLSSGSLPTALMSESSTLKSLPQERTTHTVSNTQTGPGVTVPEVKAMGIDPRMSLMLLNEMQMALNQDEDGDLPLHIAVAQENVVMVNKFIHLMAISGKSVDKYNKAQQTPLHLAVELKFEQAVALLLHAGANPNLVNKRGENSVHLAVKVLCVDCLKKMINSNLNRIRPDLNTRNFEGLAPLHTSVTMNSREITLLLLQSGADVNILDGKSGRTPLFYAVEQNNIHMVDLLQRFSANVEMPNYAGITALLAAQARGFQHIAKLLLKFDTKGTEFKDRENHVTKKVPLPRIPSKSHLIGPDRPGFIIKEEREDEETIDSIASMLRQQNSEHNQTDPVSHDLNQESQNQPELNSSMSNIQTQQALIQNFLMQHQAMLVAAGARGLTDSISFNNDALMQTMQATARSVSESLTRSVSESLTHLSHNGQIQEDGQMIQTGARHMSEGTGVRPLSEVTTCTSNSPNDSSSSEQNIVVRPHIGNIPSEQNSVTPRQQNSVAPRQQNSVAPRQQNSVMPRLGGVQTERQNNIHKSQDQSTPSPTADDVPILPPRDISVSEPLKPQKEKKQRQRVSKGKGKNKKKEMSHSTEHPSHSTELRSDTLNSDTLNRLEQRYEGSVTTMSMSATYEGERSKVVEPSVTVHLPPNDQPQESSQTIGSNRPHETIGLQIPLPDKDGYFSLPLAEKDSDGNNLMARIQIPPAVLAQLLHSRGTQDPALLSLLQSANALPMTAPHNSAPSTPVLNMSVPALSTPSTPVLNMSVPVFTQNVPVTSTERQTSMPFVPSLPTPVKNFGVPPTLAPLPVSNVGVPSLSSMGTLAPLPISNNGVPSVSSMGTLAPLPSSNVDVPSLSSMGMPLLASSASAPNSNQSEEVPSVNPNPPVLVHKDDDQPASNSGTTTPSISPPMLRAQSMELSPLETSPMQNNAPNTEPVKVCGPIPGMLMVNNHYLKNIISNSAQNGRSRSNKSRKADKPKHSDNEPKATSITELVRQRSGGEVELTRQRSQDMGQRLEDVGQRSEVPFNVEKFKEYKEFNKSNKKAASSEKRNSEKRNSEKRNNEKRNTKSETTSVPSKSMSRANTSPALEFHHITNLSRSTTVSKLAAKLKAKSQTDLFMNLNMKGARTNLNERPDHSPMERPDHTPMEQIDPSPMQIENAQLDPLPMQIENAQDNWQDTKKCLPVLTSVEHEVVVESVVTNSDSSSFATISLPSGFLGDISRAIHSFTSAETSISPVVTASSKSTISAIHSSPSTSTSPKPVVTATPKSTISVVTATPKSTISVVTATPKSTISVVTATPKSTISETVVSETSNSTTSSTDVTVLTYLKSCEALTPEQKSFETSVYSNVPQEGKDWTALGKNSSPILEAPTNIALGQIVENVTNSVIGQKMGAQTNSVLGQTLEAPTNIALRQIVENVTNSALGQKMGAQTNSALGEVSADTSDNVMEIHSINTAVIIEDEQLSTSQELSDVKSHSQEISDVKSHSLEISDVKSHSQEISDVNYPTPGKERLIKLSEESTKQGSIGDIVNTNKTTTKQESISDIDNTNETTLNQGSNSDIDNTNEATLNQGLSDNNNERTINQGPVGDIDTSELTSNPGSIDNTDTNETIINQYELPVDPSSEEKSDLNEDSDVSLTNEQISK